VSHPDITEAVNGYSLGIGVTVEIVRQMGPRRIPHRDGVSADKGMPNVSGDGINRNAIVSTTVAKEGRGSWWWRSGIWNEPQESGASSCGPENPGTVHQSAITTGADIELRPRNRQAGHSADFLVVKVIQPSNPYIVVGVDCHGSRAGPGDPRVSDNGLVSRGADPSMGIRCPCVGPWQDIGEAA